MEPQILTRDDFIERQDDIDNLIRWALSESPFWVMRTEQAAKAIAGDQEDVIQSYKLAMWSRLIRKPINSTLSTAVVKGCRWHLRRLTDLGKRSATAYDFDYWNLLPEYFDWDGFICGLDTTEIVSGVLKGLPPRDRNILQSKFGLGGRKVKSFRELSKKHKVTHQYIHQIQMKTLKTLVNIDNRGALLSAMSWEPFEVGRRGTPPARASPLHPSKLEKAALLDEHSAGPEIHCKQNT